MSKEQQRKRYTQDDIHDLIDEAFEVIQRELRSEDPYDRLRAAQQLLSTPVSMAISTAQADRDEFPEAIDYPKNEDQ